jgi:hypothetical protein
MKPIHCAKVARAEGRAGRVEKENFLSICVFCERPVFEQQLKNLSGTRKMRFLIIVKATKACEAGAMPAEERIAEMATYHEELSKAGVLLDGSGLHPSSKGWRIQYLEGSEP